MLVEKTDKAILLLAFFTGKIRKKKKKEDRHRLSLTCYGDMLVAERPMTFFLLK